MVQRNLIQRNGPRKISSCGGRNRRMRKMMIGSIKIGQMAKYRMTRKIDS
jgi:hypothetical protein